MLSTAERRNERVGAVRVLHIIPEDGIGGTEIAARECVENNEFCSLLFLTDRVSVLGGEVEERITWVPSRHPLGLATSRYVLGAHDRLAPDVVVCSLWKSFTAFLTLRFLRPKTRLVLFLHSDRSVHIADHACTRIMARLADAVFADSHTSLQRLNGYQARSRVVSFLRHPTPPRQSRKPAYHFIYWGRLQQLKNLPAAIDLFHELQRDAPEARFTIIGPDVDVRPSLDSQIAKLGLSDRISFLGARSWNEIVTLARDASFFIQLSTQEGMAMSAVEAMQLGLVIVATPVGEIANYCKDMENGVIYRSHEDAAAKVRLLMSDAVAYGRLSEAARATWSNKAVYRDDFMKAVEELVR